MLKTPHREVLARVPFVTPESQGFYSCEGTPAAAPVAATHPNDNNEMSVPLVDPEEAAMPPTASSTRKTSPEKPSDGVARPKGDASPDSIVKTASSIELRGILDAAMQDLDAGLTAPPDTDALLPSPGGGHDDGEPPAVENSSEVIASWSDANSGAGAPPASATTPLRSLMDAVAEEEPPIGSASSSPRERTTQPPSHQSTPHRDSPPPARPAKRVSAAKDSAPTTASRTSLSKRSHTPTTIASNSKVSKRTVSVVAPADGEVGVIGRIFAAVRRVVMAVVFVLVLLPGRAVAALVSRFTERVYARRQLNRLRSIMNATEDHTTWDETASELDRLQGFDTWTARNVRLTKRFCEADMLQAETRVIAKLFVANHEPSIASYLQTALHRDLYGLTQAPLYRYYRGTKVYVSEYVSATTQLIEKFCDNSIEDAVFNISAISATAHRSPWTMPADLQPQNSVHPGAPGRGMTNIGGSSGPTIGGASAVSELSAPSALDAAAPVALASAGYTPAPRPRQIPRADLEALAEDSIEGLIGDQLQRLVDIAEQKAAAARRQSERESFFHVDPNASERLPISEKISVLESALRSFGRSALLLSGGAALGMYHAGTVRALWNEGLLPRILSGSSAGAIIASIFCTRTDDEITRLCQGKAGNILDGITLNAFEMQKDVFGSGSLMDVKALMRCLKQNTGEETFLEAYQRTGRVLNVSVAAHGRDGDKTMLLNYITTPQVVIWSGVAASCAFPSLFTPVQLMQKNAEGELEEYLPGQLWFDGSVPCDLPKRRLAELFNVNYFIVSQVNPHVVPFLPKPPSYLVNKKKPAVLKRAWIAACGEMKHWLVKLYRFGLLPKSGGFEVPYHMSNQEYTGDVTIRPVGGLWRAIPDFINLTSNPTERHIEYVVSNAQRQTWPHMIQIQYATSIERCLLRCIAELKVKQGIQRHRAQLMLSI